MSNHVTSITDVSTSFSWEWWWFKSLKLCLVWYLHSTKSIIDLSLNMLTSKFNDPRRAMRLKDGFTCKILFFTAYILPLLLCINETLECQREYENQHFLWIAFWVSRFQPLYSVPTLKFKKPKNPLLWYWKQPSGIKHKVFKMWTKGDGYLFTCAKHKCLK